MSLDFLRFLSVGFVRLAEYPTSFECQSLSRSVNGALTKANADLGEEADLDDAPADSASIFTAAQNNTVEDLDEVEFDSFFGVLSMENLVVVRPYKGDEDDKVLQELRPRYIVVYDPDPAFVRRVEVSRKSGRRNRFQACPWQKQ